MAVLWREGLARQPVAVWVYDGQFKIEYEATTLVEYQVDLEKKSHRIEQVHGGRKIETPFRSPQLSLFDLEDGWLLYLPAPERAARKPRQGGSENIEQLPFPTFFLSDGVEPLRPEVSARPDLRLVASSLA